LCEGRQAVVDVQAFEPPPGKSRLAVEIVGFDPKTVLKVKGLQFFGRTHLLAAAAARLAFSDAGLQPEEIDPTRLGIVLAMTFGTLHNITSFYHEAVASGPAAVSPIDFANTVANSPASRTAILLGARGINATLAHGETAGLDGLTFSARHLAQGPEQFILTGSAYALCPDMYRAYGAQGRLSPGLNEGPEQLTPMDRRANGVVLGEAAVILALERADAARMRNARIYGFITGHAQGFDPSRGRDVSASEKIVARTMAQAIRNAGLTPDRITWVAAAANSYPELDALEARALALVFGLRPRVRVAALKSMTGECLDVAGPQGVAAAVLSITHGVVPPTANLKDPRPELPEGCCHFEPYSTAVHYVLVNALAFGGVCSSTVIAAEAG
jgi:3-oxoacyl-[acyl-carrier-protein] synthase II